MRAGSQQPDQRRTPTLGVADGWMPGAQNRAAPRRNAARFLIPRALHGQDGMAIDDVQGQSLHAGYAPAVTGTYSSVTRSWGAVSIGVFR